MFYRRCYRIRRAAQGGREVTIPPSVPWKPGDEVDLLFSDFVLVVLKGTEVDEGLLRRAVGLPWDRSGLCARSPKGGDAQPQV